MKKGQLFAIHAENWRNLGAGVDPKVAEDLGSTPFDQLDQLIQDIPKRKAQIARAIGGPLIPPLETTIGPDNAARQEARQEFDKYAKSEFWLTGLPDSSPEQQAINAAGIEKSRQALEQADKSRQES
ncbi:MAG TPA: hypothetical protein VNE40_03105 [Candidatus Dormibacteraeota bacterium]|nr:hypothetical protein [Candidatus Dormibacteraeota bacterium]